ncbi:MAG: YopX family protein [Clostridia bacterium]|nr:YopX family protein [Clostridia bacterium]
MNNKLNLKEKFFPLYRGRTCDGQWQYGVYIPKILRGALCKVPQIFDGETFHPVEYATIGRSAGCDKNSNLVFEDDVIKFTLTDEDSTHVESMLVCWSFNISGFLLYSNRAELPVDFDCGVTDGEVIGNIHDNPELLELFKNTVEIINADNSGV